LAIRLAQSAGVSLAGFARDQRMVVYAGEAGFARTIAAR
jgi:formate dehydrogenase assembly factor FdhD